MKLALLELRRRPGRFGVATVALAVLAMLLLFLGGLLDGLYLGSTGAIRAQRADVFAYSAASRDSFLRSRITPELRAEIAAVPGVDRVGGLGIALVAAAVPGQAELANAAVIGYELAPTGVPEPPKPGTAWADERLKGSGVKQGQTLLLGTAEVPVEVLGFVSDTNYLLQGGLWVEPGTWRDVQNRSRPDSRVADGVFQVVLASAPGTDVAPAAVAAAIDKATSGATSTLTKAQAELSLPGTKEQKSTFNGIIATTFLVAGLVVGLFFALLTLERIPLYGVLKALGSSTRQLFSGVLVQAVVVSLVSFALGVLVVVPAAMAAPPALPLQITPSRVLTTRVGLVVSAVLGSLFSLRKVLRTDPASAIGSAS